MINQDKKRRRILANQEIKVIENLIKLCFFLFLLGEFQDFYYSFSGLIHGGDTFN